MENFFGLIFIPRRGHRVPVPLKNVQLDVKVIDKSEWFWIMFGLTEFFFFQKVVDFIAEVNIIQDYVNQEANPIEVIYSFPVEESAAIIGFEASINGHVIVAQVKEKEKAKAEYQQAMEVKNTSVNFIPEKGQN